MAFDALGRSVGILSCLLAVSACSGALETSDDEGSLLRLTGSVGDGPVVNAIIRVYDANGVMLEEGVSDDSASYRLTLPSDATLPVTVIATGGTDLVTGRPLDFPLYAAATRSGALTVNLTPLSAVAVRASQCLGGVSDANLDHAWERIHQRLGMGLDAALVPDPIGDPVTEANVEAVVLANEALGEAVRRAEGALAGSGSPLSGDEVLEQVACDLVEAGSSATGSSVDPRVIATFKAAELAVRLETLAGRLEVDGWSAVSRMDDAIRAIMPGFSNPSVASVPANPAARRQALALLSVFLPSLDRAALTHLADGLARARLADIPALVDTALSAGVHGDLLALPQQMALADESELEPLTERMARQADAAAPMLSFGAQPARVSAGGSAQLTWASYGAETCIADGAWSGARTTQGSFHTGALHAESVYRLTCSGLGGAVSRQLNITVVGVRTSEPAPEPEPAPTPEPAPGSGPAPDPEPAPTHEPTPDPEPAPAPTVQLSAANAVVARGASTQLNWSSSHAASCSASGGWGGSKATSGSESVGPIDSQTTYSLSCRGEGGSAVAMISVSINDTVTLTWQAPTQNVDGSALTDLAGYRIYFGSTSSNYTDSLAVNDAGATTRALKLPSGTYYFAMTALDAQGNESAYSNEIVRAVQ
jgi:hypothetical protein